MDYRLDKSFESWGAFGMSEKALNIRGKIKYDPDSGIKLELAQYPENDHWKIVNQNPEMMPIYGQLVGGNLITLIDCFATNVPFHSSEILGSPIQFRVNRAIIGPELVENDKRLVNKYSIELSSLRNWAGFNSLGMKPTHDDNGRFGYDITSITSESINTNLPNHEFDLCIEDQLSLSASVDSMTVSSKAILSVIAKTPMPLKAIRNVSRNIKNLMSLLIGEHLSERSNSFTCASDVENTRETHDYQDIFQQIGAYDKDDIHVSIMLLPYKNIKSEFTALVDKWLNQSDQAVLATQIFFGSDEYTGEIVNNRLLMASQAAESYHRSLDQKSCYMKQSDYDIAINKIIKQIPDSFESDHRVSIKHRLKFGNEYSLRKRLLSLFDRLPDKVQALIAKDKSRFIHRVVDTRNYFTHYDHNARTNAYNGKHAYVAAERLRVLVAANFLQTLGVNDDELLEAIQRNRRMAHWLSADLPA